MAPPSRHEKIAGLALERMGRARVSIHLAAADDHAAARRWLAKLAPRSITYTDAVTFAVMEATGCGHALGFDRDFEAAGFMRWRLS